MTDRELSQRLSELACKLEELAIWTEDPERGPLMGIAEELHSLSNQKYTPGNTSWEDLKKVANSSNKKEYRDNKGRTTPF